MMFLSLPRGFLAKHREKQLTNWEHTKRTLDLLPEQVVYRHGTCECNLSSV